jgi:predicted small lipoprotein YifL
MRHFPKRVSRLVIPLMALLVLVGCGQAGPLYLPDSSPASTPGGTAAPTPPPVSATPAPAATPPTP